MAPPAVKGLHGQITLVFPRQRPLTMSDIRTVYPPLVGEKYVDMTPAPSAPIDEVKRLIRKTIKRQASSDTREGEIPRRSRPGR